MTELTFFGGAGDYEQGELGGVQLLFDDKKGKFFFEYGQRPDRTNMFYSFPYRAKQFEMIDIAEGLDLFASIPGLFRHDLEYATRGNKVRELPLDGILLSHAHYDHAGGFSLVRYDMPIFMHPLAQTILYVWQYTSGRTINQFVDVISQMSRSPKRHGKEKFVSGEEAILPRDIRLFDNEETFKIGDMDVTPYLVDHSLPGSSGFIIETSEGRVAISGDFRLRGRRREDTERFLEAAQDVDYFFMEGSLLHFNHYGTEEDVTKVVADLVEGKAFAGISYPPRDLDRLLSIYNACKKSKRMLVVPPNQAKLLQAFNGVNGYPRLNNKYIGVLLRLKGKGLGEKEDEFEDLIESGYYKWERPYLKFGRWDPEKGHQSKPSRVFIEDIKNNQDQFMVWMSQADMVSLLNTIKPARNSIYIRSHPGPWTKEMEPQEDQIVSILEHFEMYDGKQEDHLAKKHLGDQLNLFSKERPEVHRLHQVHVTGHMNKDETREAIAGLSKKTIIVPYHAMHPVQFLTDMVEGHRVFIPKVKRTYTLEEIAKDAR
ncbi:MAG: MBL fold metallo-hydrolase [Nanoarchaeota archaeon]|nr:MBL fold metallo-hydrolase [Nanoarchaeota archaeon]